MLATTPVMRSSVKQLLAGLSSALPFIDRTAKFPVLHYARVEGTVQGGTVETTDLRVGYVGPLAVEGAGTLLVPVRALVELLKNCDPEAVAVLSQTPSGMLRVLIGSEGRYQLPSDTREQFPLRHMHEGEVVLIPMHASVVAALMRRVLFAMNKDMIRPALAGINLRGSGSAIAATATDGYVLAHATSPREPAPDFSVLVPGDAVPQVLTWLESCTGSAPVVMRIDHAFLTLTEGDTTITIRRTEGAFVEWEHLLPASVGTCLSLERDGFLQALKRGYALRGTDKHCGTRLTSKQGSVLIETLSSQETLLAQEVLPCLHAVPEAFALLRTIHVLDALQTLVPDEATVHIDIHTATLPCVLYGQERLQHFALIIPQRDTRPGMWEEGDAFVESSSVTAETTEVAAL